MVSVTAVLTGLLSTLTPMPPPLVLTMWLSMLLASR
jgi:hypothetical protein